MRYWVAKLIKIHVKNHVSVFNMLNYFIKNNNEYDF